MERLTIGGSVTITIGIVTYSGCASGDMPLIAASTA
jgi:hypothetical protein